MQKDSRTDKKTRPSSLCSRVSLSVPTSWEELSQEQLRRAFRMLWLFGEEEDWQNSVRLSAFLYFCHIEVEHVTDQGWLCRKTDAEESFILDPALLPSLLQPLDFLLHTEQLRQLLAQVGKYQAVDFELRELMFGLYLQVENLYQAFLTTRDYRHLLSMAKVLYGVPDGDESPELRDEVLMGVFLWVGAVKGLLGEWFPHFLKPATEHAEVTQRSQYESTQAQIRLLTKGDVTKQDYILNHTDTWTALAELDALAQEAEEIKRKYGK